MTKKQKMWLGGAALAAVAVGGVAYIVTRKPAAAVPAAQLPVGVPATSFAPGQKYTFAAVLPAGATDQATLTSALTAAGWANPSILFFGPANTGAIPAGLQANASGYVASGTWNGVSTPVPTGVVAVTA